MLILPPKLGYGGSILLRSRSVCTYFENGVLIGSQLFISTYTLLPSFSRLITVIRYNYLNTHYTLLFIIVTIPRWERDISGALDNENCTVRELLEVDASASSSWDKLEMKMEQNWFLLFYLLQSWHEIYVLRWFKSLCKPYTSMVHMAHHVPQYQNVKCMNPIFSQNYL